MTRRAAGLWKAVATARAGRFEPPRLYTDRTIPYDELRKPTPRFCRSARDSGSWARAAGPPGVRCATNDRARPEEYRAVVTVLEKPEAAQQILSHIPLLGKTRHSN